jgi:hypothetical protein
MYLWRQSRTMTGKCAAVLPQRRSSRGRSTLSNPPSRRLKTARCAALFTPGLTHRKARLFQKFAAVSRPFCLVAGGISRNNRTHEHPDSPSLRL